MALRVEVHAEAAAEAAAATEWYRQEAGADVGVRFVAEVARCLRAIGDAPSRAPMRPDGARRMRTDGFPYVVVYDEHDDRAVVLAIAHTSRRPGYWSDRR